MVQRGKGAGKASTSKPYAVYCSIKRDKRKGLAEEKANKGNGYPETKNKFNGLFTTKGGDIVIIIRKANTKRKEKRERDKAQKNDPRNPTKWDGHARWLQ